MITKVKSNVLDISIIVVLLFILILIWLISSNNTKIKNQEITQLKEEVKKQSDIEILWQSAYEANINAISELEEIEILKADLKLKEENYEKNLLTKKCIESQILRMTDNLEYSLDYCKDKNNIEQFRTKKY